MSLIFFRRIYVKFNLHKIQNRPSYLCRYYNIDILKIKTKNPINYYFDELVTNGFFLRLLYQQEWVIKQLNC